MGVLLRSVLVVALRSFVREFVFVLVFLFFGVGLSGRNVFLALSLVPLFASVSYITFPIEFMSRLLAVLGGGKARSLGVMFGVLVLVLLHVLVVLFSWFLLVTGVGGPVPRIPYVPDLFELVVLVLLSLGGYLLLYFYLDAVFPSVNLVSLGVPTVKVERRGYFVLLTVVYAFGSLIAAYLVRQRVVGVVMTCFPRVVVFLFAGFILFVTFVGLYLIKRFL